MRKAQLLILVFLLITLVMACAPQAAPAPPAAPAPATAPAPAKAPVPASPGAAAPTTSGKPAWQEEWENVVAGAKKEGNVLIYSTFSNLRPQWSEAMKPYGIGLELIAGVSADIAQRILSERRLGIYSGDLKVGGAADALTLLKPRGQLDSLDPYLILPQVTDPKNWYEGKLPWVDKEHTIFCFFLLVQPTLAINTNLVKPGEVKSYNDLLDPKWRGKMAILDPTRPGTGISFVNAASEIMGWDFLKKMVENKPIVMVDERLRMEWLAHGKVAILINPQAPTFASFRQIGAPVAAVIPQEGGWVSAGSGSLSPFNRPAHPNAAKVFVNWLLSKEGGTISSKAAGSQSARLDVPTDFLDQVLVRDPSKKYLFAETEEYRGKQPEKMKIAAEVFKDVLK